MDVKKKELLNRLAAPVVDSTGEGHTNVASHKSNSKMVIAGAVILCACLVFSFHTLHKKSQIESNVTSGNKTEKFVAESSERNSVTSAPGFATPAVKAPVVSNALNATGYVVARRKATVSAEQTGKILSILVEEGQHVKAGDVLAKLDDREAQAALRLQDGILRSITADIKELELQLSSAYRSSDRADKLSKQKLISHVDEENSKTLFEQIGFQLEAKHALQDQAQAAKDLAKKRLEDTQIKAPFDGVITMKNAQPGEIISPVSTGGGFTRTGICTIVDMTSLEVEVDVNENYISKVYKDQNVDIVLNAFVEHKYAGKVIAIIPQGSRQSSTVRVRIQFQALDALIFPDMGVAIEFHEKISSQFGVVSYGR